MQAMREAVKKGDINLLEDLLDKPNADIRMVYVSCDFKGASFGLWLMSVYIGGLVSQVFCWIL